MYIIVTLLPPVNVERRGCNNLEVVFVVEGIIKEELQQDFHQLEYDCHRVDRHHYPPAAHWTNQGVAAQKKGAVAQEWGAKAHE